MQEAIQEAATNAIENLYADATDVSLPDALGSLAGGSPVPLAFSWKANDELHVGNFLGWAGPADNSHEIRVMEAMKQTEIPVPDLVTAGTSGQWSVMLAGAVDGESIASALASSGMRWEISATAFTYARMLARIHALDWTNVTPWLADPESLPEDIVDDQVEAAFANRLQAAETLDADWADFVRRVVDWLELRRPVEVSLCLCHGQYHPQNIFAVGEDITAVANWQHATVTDASYDLAMLPVWLREIGMNQEDAELFAQAVHGAYLQSSPRGFGNTPYYSVAEPLDQLIQRLTDEDHPTGESELARLKGVVERAMSVAGRVPWKNR